MSDKILQSVMMKHVEIQKISANCIVIWVGENVKMWISVVYTTKWTMLRQLLNVARNDTKLNEYENMVFQFPTSMKRKSDMQAHQGNVKNYGNNIVICSPNIWHVTSSSLIFRRKKTVEILLYLPLIRKSKDNRILLSDWRVC